MTKEKFEGAFPKKTAYLRNDDYTLNIRFAFDGRRRMAEFETKSARAFDEGQSLGQTHSDG